MKLIDEAAGPALTASAAPTCHRRHRPHRLPPPSAGRQPRTAAANVNSAGRTSVEVGVRVEAEDLTTGGHPHQLGVPRVRRPQRTGSPSPCRRSCRRPTSRSMWLARAASAAQAAKRARAGRTTDRAPERRGRRQVRRPRRPSSSRSSSCSARSATSSWSSRRLAGGEQTLHLDAGPTQGPRDGWSWWRHPGEQLHRRADADQPGDERGQRLVFLAGRAQHQVGGEAGHHHRRDQVGAAARVLLVRRRRVAAALVGGDALVLGAVVAREPGIAQHEQHRRQRTPATASSRTTGEPHLVGARHVATALAAVAASSGVLLRQHRVPVAANGRQHGERLAQPHEPAQHGHLLQATPAPGACPSSADDLYAAVRFAHGGGPVAVAL